MSMVVFSDDESEAADRSFLNFSTLGKSTHHQPVYSIRLHLPMILKWLSLHRFITSCSQFSVMNCRDPLGLRSLYKQAAPHENKSKQCQVGHPSLGLPQSTLLIAAHVPVWFSFSSTVQPFTLSSLMIGNSHSCPFKLTDVIQQPGSARAQTLPLLSLQ